MRTSLLLLVLLVSCSKDVPLFDTTDYVQVEKRLQAEKEAINAEIKSLQKQIDDLRQRLARLEALHLSQGAAKLGETKEKNQ